MSRTGKADHERPLMGYARFDRNCVGTELPIIDLDVPPSHGVVCLRRSDIRLQNVYGSPDQHCLGQKVSGVRIVYLPRHGYTGADTFRYTVHLRVRITNTYNLTIEPDAPPSPDAVPADISAADDTPQSPGPIPACPALVS